MKTLVVLSLMLLVVLSGAVMATPVAAAAPVAPESAEPLACPICEVDLSDYDGPLSEEEVLGLLKALNDEYHALAVYDQVLADYGGVQPFSQIRQSEARHIDSLLRLFVTYGVPIPDNSWAGNVPSFESLKAACEAGVEAEIANVALYDDLFASTEREDILRVYEALQSASNENHLPAFQRCVGSARS